MDSKDLLGLISKKKKAAHNHATKWVFFDITSGHKIDCKVDLRSLLLANMNLIGATYIRASRLSSHAPDLTEFDFRPRLTSEYTAWIAT